MSTRTFAMIFGIVFLAVGIAGFVPQLVQTARRAATMAMDGGHGMLLGMFPVNTLHNIVHLLFGLWGLAASRSAGGAVTYARGVAIIYAVLTVCGLIPSLDDLFGLVPLHGNNVWLHGAPRARRRLFRLGQPQPRRGLIAAGGPARCGAPGRFAARKKPSSAARRACVKGRHDHVPSAFRPSSLLLASPTMPGAIQTAALAQAQPQPVPRRRPRSRRPRPRRRPGGARPRRSCSSMSRRSARKG